MKRLSLLCGLAAFAYAGVAAADVTVNVSALDAQGASTPVGNVRLVETRFGLALYPNLRNLQPGLHGFHVHENPSCAPTEADGKKVPGGAAGGHYDPESTKKHGEPWGGGHLGSTLDMYQRFEAAVQMPSKEGSCHPACFLCHMISHLARIGPPALEQCPQQDQRLWSRPRRSGRAPPGGARRARSRGWPTPWLADGRCSASPSTCAGGPAKPLRTATPSPSRSPRP